MSEEIKKLIERLARKNCCYLKADGESYVFTIDDLENFLSAYLAERGKEAVGHFTVSQGKSINQVIYFETGLPDGDYKLFLAPQIPEGKLDAFPQAHRLAMELECLLLSCEDTVATAKWWDSANDALEQWRKFCHEDAAAGVKS